MKMHIYCHLLSRFAGSNETRTPDKAVYIDLFTIIARAQQETLRAPISLFFIGHFLMKELPPRHYSRSDRSKEIKKNVTP